MDLKWHISPEILAWRFVNHYAAKQGLKKVRTMIYALTLPDPGPGFCIQMPMIHGENGHDVKRKILELKILRKQICADVDEFFELVIVRTEGREGREAGTDWVKDWVEIKDFWVD
jgi:hypothetical protein